VRITLIYKNIMAKSEGEMRQKIHMSRSSILVLGLVLWAAVVWYCIPHDGHHIQHDLTSRSVALLASHDISSSGLAVDGRDITLTGYAGTPEVSDGAVKLVRAMWGVRSVHTNILHRPGPPKASVSKQQAYQAAASISGILKLRNVEFYSGTDRLTSTGQQTLNQVAAVLAKYPGMPVEIAGHTDSVGVPARNLELSRKRAAAVKQYLIEKGIAGGSLSDTGIGETQPIASNKTAAGRQLNRRVEFHTKESK
jgi:outer membrane protein OmpA-like peptidoglycan-associated protein